MNLQELTDEQINALRTDLGHQIVTLREQIRDVTAEHNLRLRKQQIKARYGAAGAALLDVLPLDQAVAKIEAMRAAGTLQEHGRVIKVDGQAGVAVAVKPLG